MAKGKRWQKGQSSSSNPTSHKHRDVAKSTRSFFTFGLPASSNDKYNNTSQLTRKALAELDSMSLGNDNFEDSKSVVSDGDNSADSFRSWATNWSDCTNATFNKVHKYWRSNSAFHKEILAVLATITEVIKENNGKESETEYLAALMTGLESVKSSQESSSAFLYLIALAIKKVPENVLRAKHSDLIKSLVEQLDQHGNIANNVTLIKSCLKCLCWILKSLGKQEWQNKSAISCYMKILEYVNDDRSKVRKCGQEAVRLILNSCASSVDGEAKSNYDFISKLTADFCLDLIINDGKDKQEETDDNNNNRKQTTKSKNQRILHILTLLKHIVYHFSVNKLKTIGECLLRLMTLKDILITSHCFQIFHELFNSQKNHLNPELNAQMINAFYDYQPSENDPQQLIGWLAVVESSLKCLNRLNKNLCLSHLPHFFQITMLTLISHHQNVQVMATNCMKSILEQCVQTNIDLFIDDIKQSVELKKSLLYKIFSSIENGLGFQYHMSWVFVMKILACAFTSFKNGETFVVVESCLSSLGNLRESEQFNYKKEADFAIGRAIQTYGPKLMLDCIPLNISGDETSYEYPRSWMLPLLKDFTEKTELAYFVNTLLPLANKLKQKSKVFLENKCLLEHRIFDTLQNQIWSLLPGFCNFPTDFAESFKGLARCLGETLEKCSDLRPHILHALRTLINRNTDENRVLMSRYAKNYLPIMFNIYTTEVRLDKDPARQSILDTIKFYLNVTDRDLVNSFLTQAMKNYESNSKLHQSHQSAKSEDTTNQKATTKVKFDFNKLPNDSKTESSNNIELDPYLFAKYSFLDLIFVLARYSNETNINTVYELALDGIENKELDKTLQKKCYKILDSILASGKKEELQPKSIAISKQNTYIYDFVKAKFEGISNKFIKSLSDCNVAAKVPRLKCLLDLMDYISEPEQKIFLRHILPEVILCIKEINHKSRDASFLLLNSMLRTWQKLGLVSNVAENESLDEFMHLVMVGLAGSSNMISCSCLALASLSHEFKENITGELINDLIETACLLTRSDQKEVITSSLNLLKILITIFNKSMLASYLEKICETVHGLHEKRIDKNNEQPFDNTPPVNKSQQIRQFVKSILKKLIKKFNYEIVFEKVFKYELTSKPSVNEMDTTDIENRKLLVGGVKQSLENLLVNIKKSMEKEKKRKEELEKAGGDKNKSNSGQELDLISMYTSKTQQTTKTNYEVEDLLKESDSESEDNEADAKSKKTGKTNKSKKEKSKRDGNGGDNYKHAMAWLQENENDDPLDLLDPMAIKRVMATKPLSKQEIEKKKAKELNSKTKNRGFSTDKKSGKLVIDDDDDDSDSDDGDMKSKKSKKSSKKKSPNEIEEMMDTLSLSKKSNRSKKTFKRSAEDSASDLDDNFKDNKSKYSSYKPGGSGIHRRLDHNKKDSSIHGKEYKARKSSGDVKIKNKPDPYAYIPLNFGKLNKRKRAKLQGEYKGIVKAVKKGASNGKKTKRL